MRLPGCWSLLLLASFISSIAGAAPVTPESAPAAATPPPEPAPLAPPTPVPEPAPPLVEAAPEPSTTEPLQNAAPVAPVSSPPSAAARSEATSPVGASPVAADLEPPTDFTRDFSALPLTLEARFGFNARLGSRFDDAVDEEHWGPSFAFASYLAYRPEFALGLELDHSGLGRVRALSGQSSVDNQYSATGAWLAARVFPIRRERFDFFVNLRVGMVWQHVDALGTRSDSSNITVPAQSYSCGAWDGPGFGLGGSLGLAYRLGRHFALVSRLDLTGERLSSDSIDECGVGIGSVASLGGSVGLAFELETAPK